MSSLRKMMILGVLVSLLVVGGAIQAYATGETVTVKGEIIDTYCYALMGAKGPSHRECAIECAKKGIPVGILQEGTNKVYVLLPNKDKTSLPPAVIDNMAKVVTVTGKVYTSGGSQFLTVESIK